MARPSDGGSQFAWLVPDSRDARLLPATATSIPPPLQISVKD
ncbi:hypothetical protein E2C01_020593 [Portunus trituberculatus]|uniref:Uncharacterized protein n=1 Tax=Portunus trituberculatus TaxID=210409 RepID=A0A5B7E2G8_PORTR|nr:hypothetical protein [Portunus trituberculatus]